MPDFYELDFRQVHTSKSGDAIAIRYQIGSNWNVCISSMGGTPGLPRRWLALSEARTARGTSTT